MKNAKITKAITNCQVVLENGILWDAVLLISDNKIAEYGPMREVIIPDGAEIIDAKGKYVGPGLIDIHVHGGAGYSTCFEPVEAARHFLKHGATSFLATPSYSLDFNGQIEAIRSIKKHFDEIKNLKGIYMEGPYTNPKFGSHSYANPWRHPITADEYKPIIDEAGELAKVWTIAPELEGINEVVEYAKKVNPNTIIAIGHSEATPMQARALGKYRPTLLTHAMCATKRLPVYGGTRGYGPDEYAFKDNDVYAELISDSCCIHVHKEMQQLLLHCKGLDKVVLITDSSVHDDPPPANLAHVNDLNFDANGGIAGSKMTMDQACRNIMTHTNCGIAQAFILASRNPARVLGLDSELGTIEVGKTADLIIVDDRFNIDTVILDGEVCNF